MLWLVVASSHGCDQGAGSPLIFDGNLVCGGTFLYNVEAPVFQFSYFTFGVVDRTCKTVSVW